MGYESPGKPPRPDILLVLRAATYGRSTFERAVAIGALTCARTRGWSIVPEYENQQKVERWIDKWRPRAVLTAFQPPAVVARAAAMAPTVAAMCYTDGVNVHSIDVDREAVAHAAADHMLGLGLKSFAVLGRWRERWAPELRVAFQRRLRQAGSDCAMSSGAELSRRETEKAEPTQSALGAWIAKLPKPVGIYTIHDPWGFELAKYCLAAGVAVPEEVSIVGSNNDNIVCEMASPPLSSVAINWEQIGYDAALAAGTLAEGGRIEKVRRLVKPAGVVIRQSSDLLSVSDPDVAAALRIIRDHADRPLHIAEILKRIPVHRHWLERQFRQLVGRRMLQEIRRVHVEQAKRLLVSTDLPMPEVANRSGLVNAGMLAVAFRLQLGVTPSEFRRGFRLHA